jgi:hypothetical protein
MLHISSADTLAEKGGLNAVKERHTSNEVYSGP